MRLQLGIAIAACALMAIVAPYFWPALPSIHYIFKPTATVLILVLALLSPISRYKIGVLLGLLFSLIGDVFLMLPSDHFLAGLICFLIAHLCYITTFLSDSKFGRPVWTYVLLAAIGTIIFVTLSPGIAPAMKIPVAIYAAALSLMTAQAIARYLQQKSRGALFAAIGAVLFLISDSLLAFDRFHTTFAAAHAIVLATYYLAQYFIALSTHKKSG